ncbi:PspC domain-containing protein [Myxococcota bacterium]|nr:PspC domain-containing protein [Myxococcota bacterium]
MNIGNQHITRSKEGYLGGVCEGLGTYLGIPPVFLRLAWLVTIFFFGSGILAYLLLWWLVPEEGEDLKEASISTFHRTLKDRKLAGVCGGLARYWQVDPTLVRLAAIGLMTISLGTVIVVYILAIVFIPDGSEVKKTATDSFHI